MTPELEAILQKARDSIMSAKLQRNEGFYDFAVSRAYYAMFYCATALLRNEGLTFSKHSAVVGKFGELFAKTGRVPSEFHRYLIVGQEDRHTGDYDFKIRFPKAKADEHIENAEKFLEMTENLLKSPASSSEEGDQ